MRNNLIFNNTYLELVENNISKFSNKWDISQIHNFLSCRCGIDAQIDLDIINRIRYHDTLLMARYLIPNDRVSQPVLCKRYNVKNEKEHRAMGDVNSLIKLYKIYFPLVS